MQDGGILAGVRRAITASETFVDSQTAVALGVNSYGVGRKRPIGEARLAATCNSLSYLPRHPQDTGKVGRVAGAVKRIRRYPFLALHHRVRATVPPPGVVNREKGAILDRGGELLVAQKCSRRARARSLGKDLNGYEAVQLLVLGGVQLYIAVSGYSLFQEVASLNYLCFLGLHTLDLSGAFRSLLAFVAGLP
jgi:hypothetical protein